MFEEEIETLNGLLTSVEFLGGFVAGLAVLVAFAVSRRLRASRSIGYAAWTAVILAVALYLDFGRRLGAFAGLAVLAISGWWLDNRSKEGDRILPWAGVLTGAVVFAWRSGLEAPDWALAAIPVFVIGVGASFFRWRETGLGRLLGPVIAIAAIGIWATIPDTEMARVLLGCTLPLFVITPLPLEAPITASGAMTLAAMIAWIVVQGGADRPASIVGAMGCFTVPVVIAFLIGARSLSIRGGAATLIGIHVVTAVISSRLIGLAIPFTPAVGSLTILAGLATVVLWVASSPRRPLPT